MTGYLYHGNPLLEQLNARIMASRAANPAARGATPRRDQTDGKSPDGVIRHGTSAGYRAHRRYDEDACPACLEAERNRSRVKPGASGLNISQAQRARWARIRGGSGE
jgi:hypothetical protein